MQVILSPSLVHTHDTSILPVFQDHILPYLADEWRSPDTLFFVCEEDFRLLARYSICNSASLVRLSEAVYAASSTAWRARRPAPVFSGTVELFATEPGEVLTWRHSQHCRAMAHEELFGPPASGTDNRREYFGGMYMPSSKPSKREIEH